MKYIIMCGGDYTNWETPRQLVKINGEEIVARTIRLLKEAGCRKIYISTDNEEFTRFEVPLLFHNNDFTVLAENGKVTGCTGWWVDAFYPTDEPTTYLFGDVVYSPEAIRTIIETETDDIEFFGSRPPYDERYFKAYPEPFAFKVVNTNHMRQAILDCKINANRGMFWRPPISWELWTTINHGRLKKKRDVYKDRYTVINDYTCDVDTAGDVQHFERIFNGEA